MMIDKASWHYRFLKAVWRDEDFPKSLCWYVDLLIFTILFSVLFYPLITIGYWLDKKIKPREIEIPLWLNILIFYLLISTLSLLLTIPSFGLLGIVYGFLLGGLLGGIIFGSIFGVAHIFSLLAEKYPQRFVYKEKKPSLVGEWLKAKHSKICPRLEFTDKPSK